MFFLFRFLANRKAWGGGYCFAIKTQPHYSPFKVEADDELMSGLVPKADEDSYTLQCFPLFTTLLAVGNPTVNYLSLDIEGAEFLVRRPLGCVCHRSTLNLAQIQLN